MTFWRGLAHILFCMMVPRWFKATPFASFFYLSFFGNNKEIHADLCGQTWWVFSFEPDILTQGRIQRGSSLESQWISICNSGRNLRPIQFGVRTWFSGHAFVGYGWLNFCTLKNGSFKYEWGILWVPGLVPYPYHSHVLAKFHGRSKVVNLMKWTIPVTEIKIMD